MSSKVLGRVFGWREGGRAQGSEFLGVWPRPLAGGVNAERCGGWTGVWARLPVCIGRARAKGLAVAPLLLPGVGKKQETATTLQELGKLLLGQLGGQGRCDLDLGNGKCWAHDVGTQVPSHQSCTNQS